MKAAQADTYSESRRGIGLSVQVYFRNAQYDGPMAGTKRKGRYYRLDALSEEGTYQLEKSLNAGLNGEQDAPAIFDTEIDDRQDYIRVELCGWRVVGASGEVLSEHKPEH